MSIMVVQFDRKLRSGPGKYVIVSHRKFWKSNINCVKHQLKRAEDYHSRNLLLKQMKCSKWKVLREPYLGGLRF